MNTLDAIAARRAIKHFDPEFEIPQVQADKLVEYAILAPSSFNIQHWRFVQVDDAELRQQMRQAAWNQAQVSEASLLYILCADLLAWDNDPAQYWREAPQTAQDVLVPMIQPFYRDNPQLQRDEAMRSVGFAAQNMMLAAKAMGYDSCPMIGFDEQKVAELIGLPEHYAIGMMLTIGKAAKPAWPKPGQLGIEEIRVKNRFNA